MHPLLQRLRSEWGSNGSGGCEQAAVNTTPRQHSDGISLPRRRHVKRHSEGTQVATKTTNQAPTWSARSKRASEVAQSSR